MAGKDRDEELAEYVRDRWIEYGFDSVELNPYELLLSYPSDTEPNEIKLWIDDKVNYTSRNREEFPDMTLDSDFVDGYLGFSPEGYWEGNVVYVNYGRVEDFAMLTNTTSDYYTDLKDMICMARYGKIFRGNKEDNAYRNGCKALIIFSDPEQVATEGTDPENVYPNTFFLPGSGKVW